MKNGEKRVVVYVEFKIDDFLFEVVNFKTIHSIRFIVTVFGVAYISL